MKTVTYDPELYKLVPIQDTRAMREAFLETQFVKDTFSCSYKEMLQQVPDQLPGVVEHSGEPMARAYSLGDGDFRIDYSFPEERDYELYTHPAPSQPSGHNVTILKSVWESWQTWGNAWFSVCAALTEAWPSWNMAKGKNAIQAACDMIRQLGAWENARRSASQPSAEALVQTALEAAAKECEAEGKHKFGTPKIVQRCAAAIRALDKQQIIESCKEKS